MSSSKVIIVTGASRGIGLAIAEYLLKAAHKLVLVARSAEPLENLKKQYPGQVEILVADLSDLSVGGQVTSIALEKFSRIDGLVINHGTLGTVKRIGDSTAEEWRSTFDVNFFSAVSLVQASIPALRNSHGRIILVSSGVSVGAYSTWGAYGSSKAAMNHLALTLNVEEPLITSVAIRPGIVDTAMQKEIREEHKNNMDKKDVEKFTGLHGRGELLKPEKPGNVIAKLVLNAQRNLGGKFIRFVTSCPSGNAMDAIKPFANNDEAGMITSSKTSRTSKSNDACGNC